MNPQPRRIGWAVTVKEFSPSGELLAYDLQADGMSEAEAAELAREWVAIGQRSGRSLETEVFYVAEVLA